MVDGMNVGLASFGRRADVEQVAEAGKIFFGTLASLALPTGCTGGGLPWLPQDNGPDGGADISTVDVKYGDVSPDGVIGDASADGIGDQGAVDVIGDATGDQGTADAAGEAGDAYADMGSDTALDTLLDSGQDVSIPPIVTLCSNLKENICISDPDVPAEFSELISGCLSVVNFEINGKPVDATFDFSALTFLDPTSNLSVEFATNNTEPLTLVGGGIVKFQPVTDAFEKNDAGIYVEGAWTGMADDMEIIFTASYWDGVKVYMDIQYSATDTCRSMYDYPCDANDVVCE